MGGQIKNYGANSFYSLKYPDQYDATRTLFTTLSWNKVWGPWQLSASAYWRTHYDRFELIRNMHNAPAWYTGHNYHVTHVNGLNLQAAYATRIGRTTMGVEVRNEYIKSNVLGDLLNEPKPIPFVPDTCFIYGKNRLNINYFAQQAFYVGRFSASVGISGNWNTMFAHNFCLGANVGYAFVREGRVYINVNRSLRLPTFTDLYYKSPTHEGNQGMSAEESHSVQLGTTYRTEAVDATVKAFYHRGTNMIDWVMYTADDVFHSANFDLDNMGVQAQATLRFAPLFGKADSYLQRLSVGYTYLHQRRRDDTEIYKSNYAMEYLRHKLVATLDHRIVSHLSASWCVRWQDRMGDYILYEDGRSTGQLVSYSPYATLDLKLRWTERHYEVWVEGTNLTNHTYYDLGNIPQPGIVVLAGVRVRF